MCHLELASDFESDLRDTVYWGRKWTVDFNSEKSQLVSFDRSKNTGAIDVKMDGSGLGENHLLRCWGWPSPLNWIGAITLSLLLKLPPKNDSLKFLSPEVALYLYKSTIRPSSFAAFLKTLAHRRNVASLSLFYKYCFCRCSSELAQLVLLPDSRGWSTRYSDRLHHFFVTIPKCYKDVYVISFFPHLARLRNSLPIECFL